MKYYKVNKDICVSVVTVLTETPVNEDDSEMKRHVEQLSLALDVIKNGIVKFSLAPKLVISVNGPTS